jgi:alpha-1,2-mannosyltransferase
MNVRAGAGTLQRIATDAMDVHADFHTFWLSAAAFWAGESVYDTGARLVNLNPPLWTLLVSPLGLLEAIDAYRLFILLSLAVTVGYLAWTAEELRLRSGWAVPVAGALLVSSPFLATLALGQVYPMLALGLVAAWVAERRGRLRLSGVSLGLVVAVKPSLAPVLLWPAVRRRWGMLASAVVTGAAVTLLSALVVGFGAAFEWVRLVMDEPLSAYWDNASIPSAAARLFAENEFAEPLAVVPGAVPAGYVLGFLVVALTAYLVRRDGGDGMGLWAMVAAALLASPISWHNYLVLLAPGVLVLISRGRAPVALLLLSLQLVPPQWPLLWSGSPTALATLALTLYFFILLAHWLSFLGPASGRARKGAGAGGAPLRRRLPGSGSSPPA